MLRGVLSHSGDAAEHLRASGMDGGWELVSRGPLAVAWPAGDGVTSSEDDGVLCVVSGYLYEPQAQARELGISGSDAAELVLQAYRRLGEEALTRLRGRFAVVLWDGARRAGLIACDPLATEAIFFSRSAGRLVFGSEHRDVLALMPSTPGPDLDALIGWLGGHGVEAHRTLYEGVSHLRPFHLLELGDAASDQRPYWAPRYEGTLTGSRAELAEGLREQLERSVRRRLSPETTAVILSGGLDSSIVTACATRVQTEGRLETYSALFPGRHFDESAKIRSVADQLGIEPNGYHLEPQGAVWLGLRSVQEWRLPLIAVGAVIESGAATEAASDGARVLLDGQTGDETLGFAPYLVSDRLRQGRLLGALALTRRWPLGRAMSWREQLMMLKRVGLRGAVPYELGQRIRTSRRREGEGPPFMAPHARARFLAMADQWTWKQRAEGPLWWRYLSDRLTEAPHRELRFDFLRHRAGSFGLVNESPLYDMDLIDFCLRLPPEIAFERAFTRPLAREAMEGILPDIVRLRDDKANFSDLCYDIITGRDAAIIDRLLMAPDAEIGAFADMDWLRRRWRYDRPQPGRTGSWGAAIWGLVTSELWLRSLADDGFVERTLADPDVRPFQVRRVPIPDTGSPAAQAA